MKKKFFKKKYKYRNAYSIINSFNEIKKFYNICNKQKKIKVQKITNIIFYGLVTIMLVKMNLL